MHCTHCKKQTAQNAKFCGFCGNKINPATSHGLLDSARFSRGFEKSPSILERTEVAPISSLNDDDRIFFVLGLTIYRDQRLIDWLVQHYPNARIVQFSNRAVIQRQVYEHGKSGNIDGLCLIGSAHSIPPFIIGNGSRQDPGLGFESDSFYTSQVLPVNEVPNSSTEKVHVHKRFERLGADALIGVVPVGRIPTDNPDIALSYLSALRLPRKSGAPSWICVSATNADWMSESEAVLRHVGANAAIVTAPQATERTLSYQASLSKFSDRLIGSNLVVNLHGAAPTKGARQLLIGDPQGPPYVDLSDLGDVAHSTSFLFSCHGGHSGWWEDGIVGTFLAARARAVVASSGSVFTTDLSRPIGSIGAHPPGAVQLCASFFDKINDGLNYGQALMMAKSETLIDAIELGPEAFAFALKEVTQFSLFGAPWATPFYGVDNEAREFQSPEIRAEPTRLIDRVRSGAGAPSQFSASVGILNRMRDTLRERLGGDVFYANHNLSLSNIRSQASQFPDKVISSLSSLHITIDDLSCDNLEISGNQFYLFCDSPSGSGYATLMDRAGHVLGRYNLKGTS